MIGAPSMTSDALRMQPIIGWRAWIASTEPPRLWSLARPATWAPGELVEAHATPTSDPRAGIHAFRTCAEALGEFMGGWGDGLVLGSVAMWGQVVEHERGFRAQYAYPQTLVLPGSWDSWGPWADSDTVRALARTYGCEVRPLADVVGGDPLAGMTVSAPSCRHYIFIDDDYGHMLHVYDRRRQSGGSLDGVGRLAVQLADDWRPYVHVVACGRDSIVAVAMPSERAVAVFAANTAPSWPWPSGTVVDALTLGATLGPWATPYGDLTADRESRLLARAHILRYARAHIRAADAMGASS